MNTLPIKKFLPNASQLAFGCMSLGGSWDANPIDQQHISHAHQAIDAALEAGINFFDHADIYTLGKAEQVFGEVLKQRPELRETIILQSKCAIKLETADRPQQYDSSRDWITHSVEGTLSRLGIEQLDILELHRHDPLMEPEEVAEAFTQLKASGKVKYFGVSNMNAPQIDFLQSYLTEPLVCNQLEMSLQQHSWVDEGIFALTPEGASLSFTAGTVEYCRKNNVQLQSWGSLAQGLFTGKDVSGHPAHIQKTATLVSDLAAQYQVSREAIVLAWLMRHPAKIQPVMGTSNPGRIKACAQATTIELNREQWYALYVSARGQRLP